MNSYKLTYFNLRGVAEPIRLMFKYAEVPFEDKHVDCSNWKEEKMTFKWQQLPFLEYNNLMLTQTSAIMAFLEKEFNLSPEDSWDQARCTEIIGAVNDLRLAVKPVLMERISGALEKVEDLSQKLLTSVVPLFLRNMEEILQDIRKSKTDCNSNFILGGDKPTAADFWLAHFTDQWNTYLNDTDLLEKFELLKLQQNAVYSLPAVKEWIKERPEMLI